MYQKALGVRRECGHDNDMLHSLRYFGMCHEGMANFERAMALYDRALELSEACLGPGTDTTVVKCLNNVAMLHHKLGDSDHAVEVSLIPHPSSLIPSPQFLIPNPQSLIPNPQSLIPNP